MALQLSDRGKGIPKMLPLSALNPTLPTTTNPSTLLEPVGRLLFSILPASACFFVWLNQKFSIFGGVVTRVSLIEGQSLSVSDERIVAKRHEKRWRKGEKQTEI